MGLAQRNRSVGYEPGPASGHVNSLLSADALDDHACRELFHHYYPGLVRHAARQQGADPEAAASKAMLDGFNAFARNPIRDEPAFRSYLYKAAQSNARMQIRRRRPSPTDVPHQPESVAGQTAHVATDLSSGRADGLVVDAHEQLVHRDWVNGLVSELPVDQRQVIEARFQQDLTPKQTAERLGKSVNSVHQLQHRAVGSLRRAVLAAALLGVVAALFVAAAWLQAQGANLSVDTGPIEQPQNIESRPSPDQSADTTVLSVQPGTSQPGTDRTESIAATETVASSTSAPLAPAEAAPATSTPATSIPATSTPTTSIPATSTPATSTPTTVSEPVASVATTSIDPEPESDVPAPDPLALFALQTLAAGPQADFTYRVTVDGPNGSYPGTFARETLIKSRIQATVRLDDDGAPAFASLPRGSAIVVRLSSVTLAKLVDGSLTEAEVLADRGTDIIDPGPPSIAEVRAYQSEQLAYFALNTAGFEPLANGEHPGTATIGNDRISSVLIKERAGSVVTLKVELDDLIAPQVGLASVEVDLEIAALESLEEGVTTSLALLADGSVSVRSVLSN